MPLVRKPTNRVKATGLPTRVLTAKPVRKPVIKEEGVGQRGKTAQKLVQDYFKIINERFATFSYMRIPDARAAGGRLGKVCGDFLCWWLDTDGDYRFNYSVPLEVKSTKHDYRLPAKSVPQLPALKKLAKSGAQPYVLVLFKGIGKWRIAHIDYFGFGVSSFDMRDLPLYDTVQAAVESTGVFPRYETRF